MLGPDQTIYVARPVNPKLRPVVDKRSRSLETITDLASKLSINVGIRIAVYANGRAIVICLPAPTVKMSPFDIAAHWQSLGIDARTN